jgi:predicted O-methyltransferase YrrM
MQLPSQTSWGSLAPRLIGSFEEELHEVIEELIATTPDRVINVGCAEGYYAVGFARRLPNAEIFAFDIDERAQRLARETARSNGVGDRVQVSGRCSLTTLEELLVPGSLVFMDCEGCELELLCPERAPSLTEVTVVVELHDFVDPKISSEIAARFRRTHSARFVGVRQRVPDLHPAVAALSPADRVVALAEPRPTEPHPMEWAVLVPRRARACPGSDDP